MLVDDEGHTYTARFYTRLNFCDVRLPLNAFRAEVPAREGPASAAGAPPPLRPERVVALRFRCAAAAGKSAALGSAPASFPVWVWRRVRRQGAVRACRAGRPVSPSLT